VTIPNWPTFIYRFGAVFLCPVFWEVSTTGTDSQVSLLFSESSKVYREIYGLHSRVEHWFMSLLTLPLTLELRTMSMVNPAANNSPPPIPLKLSIMLIRMNISQRTTQPCRRRLWQVPFVYYHPEFCMIKIYRYHVLSATRRIVRCFVKHGIKGWAWAWTATMTWQLSVRSQVSF
jgi:hypothetical protein